MTIQNFGLYINLGNIARATDVCNTTLASTKMKNAWMSGLNGNTYIHAFYSALLT